MSNWSDEEILCKRLSLLTPREEQVIRMLDGIGMRRHSHAEVAERLRTSSNVMAKVEVRARKKLGEEA